MEDILYLSAVAVSTAIGALAGLAQGRQSRKLLEQQHRWALEVTAKQSAKTVASADKVIAAIADNTQINTKALNAANGVTDKLADMVSFTGGVGPVDAARVLISIQQTVRLMQETIDAQKKYSHESIHEINRSLSLLQDQVGKLESSSFSTSLPKVI